jgi:hypothetical protein
VKRPIEQAVINFNVSQPAHCGGVAKFIGSMDEGITGLLHINTMDYLDPYRCNINPGRYTNYFTIYVDGEEDSIISFQV